MLKYECIIGKIEISEFKNSESKIVKLFVVELLIKSLGYIKLYVNEEQYSIFSNAVIDNKNVLVEFLPIVKDFKLLLKVNNVVLVK